VERKAARPRPATYDVIRDMLITPVVAIKCSTPARALRRRYALSKAKHHFIGVASSSARRALFRQRQARLFCVECRGSDSHPCPSRGYEEG